MNIARINYKHLLNYGLNSISSNVKRCLSQSIYLVDECKQEVETNNNLKNNVNKYTRRTATCGELTMQHVGQHVKLCGWLQFSRMDKFLVLRDAYGQTQLIIGDKNSLLMEKVKGLDLESALEVKGTVIARPKEMINYSVKTGEIEVSVEDLQIANKATTLPFNIREYQKANEALRMQYRYLDLRFSEMQRNLRFRSEFCMRIRDFLVNHCGFVDVETPTLFKATPGGAQEFVVPTKYKDRFYSLVQSPQQFKQMLMCGGIDRYFQIARCYRDETSRPDRQPEFTQLDIEMSFTSMDGIMELIEDLLQYSWPQHLQPIAKKFPRMSYLDALENYGTDQPDIRYDNKLIDCTDLLTTTFYQGAVPTNFYVGCLVFDGHEIALKRKTKDYQMSSTDYPMTKILQIKCKKLEDFATRLGQHVKDEEVLRKLQERLQVKDDTTVFMVFGRKHYALKRLGKIREVSAEYLHENGTKMYQDGMHFLWIVDFPLFSRDDDGQLSAEHHPFTSPHLDDVSLLETDPLKMRALSYDLVLNGNEVGGGSIRIHDASFQQKMLDKLHITGLDHIVEMLSYGCPPHGGIALGLDRLFARILNTPSIRDVIAFPKTFDGKDPLSGAPSLISDACKKMYHL